MAVIRDNIEGNRLIDKPDYIRDVIDTPEFQRLRSIRQMGLASYVFPGAEHSRFIHSIGVFGTAIDAFRQLKGQAQHYNLIMPGLRFDDYTEFDFCIAAMCHDLGHTAFSHVLETTLLPADCRNHEECTIRVISEQTKIAKAIHNVADKDAVIALIKGQHSNKALNDLISSSFDVDRCDYVIRDSYMSGVEYGQFDLKWLLRSLHVDLNLSGQPILILDGPRGMDALRQFLSARRYMHRQVYYHKSVRSAQVLLKSIFERIQDIGPNQITKRFSPRSIQSLISGRSPTLGEFLETTDVEVLHMIRNFAQFHKDKVLKYLCIAFLERRIPKCILDSSRLTEPLSHIYRIADDPAKEASDQGELQLLLEDTATAVLDKLRDFVANQMARSSLPPEAARYLVKFDPVRFRSALPSDFLFSFKGVVLPFTKIDADCVGFDITALLEEFTITRLYVPRDVVGEAQDFLDREYRI